MTPLRTRNGIVHREAALAWLWISWIRKYGLTVQIIKELRDNPGTNHTTQLQADLVVTYFGQQGEQA